MPIRVVLANLAGHPPDKAVLKSAREIALGHGAHVTVSCLHRPELEHLVEDRLLSPQARLSAARECFESWSEEHALPIRREPTGSGFSAEWLDPEAIGGDALIRSAAMADMVVTAPPRGWLHPGQATLKALLFESGRPLLLVHPTTRRKLDSHVVIAWNGSREAARVVAFGLPFLQAAERVSIFSRVDREKWRAGCGPEDLVESLGWNGIAATLLQRRDAGDVGADLLACCHEHGAGLLLTGAYARGPLRERIAGGVTRHLLDEPALPMMMMH
jgi:nucleotide-binding universal stress UspA family protein